MPGFLICQRDRFDHDVFRREVWCRGYAWDWMVAQAAWTDYRQSIKGKTVTLKRGQFSHSERFMAERFRWSRSTLQRFLTRLQTEHMIGLDSGPGQFVITICNYDKYQCQDEKGGPEIGPVNGPEAGQKRAKEEQEKQTNKIEEGRTEAQAPAKSTDGDIRSELENLASTAAITSFMAYRRKSKGKALTLTAAKRVATHLKAIFDGGGDPDEALAMAEERGWLTVEPDWYFNAKGKTNGQRTDSRGLRPGPHNALMAGFAMAADPKPGRT